MHGTAYNPTCKISKSEFAGFFSPKFRGFFSQFFRRFFQYCPLPARFRPVVPRAARDKPMASRLERDCTSREDAGHDNRLAIRRLVSAAVQPPDAAYTLKDECRKPANQSGGRVWGLRQDPSIRNDSAARCEATLASSCRTSLTAPARAANVYQSHARRLLLSATKVRRRTLQGGTRKRGRTPEETRTWCTEVQASP